MFDYELHKFAGDNSISTECLRTLSGLFSPNLIDQSSCRILITHAKTRSILHDDWPVRLGGNRHDRALKHLAAMLELIQCITDVSICTSYNRV